MLSNIITWTPYEQVVYFSRIGLVLLAAAFFASLVRVVLKRKFKELSITGKLLMIMLFIYSGNIIVFYLGYALARPVVTIGSLRNVADVVVLVLGIWMVNVALKELEGRKKKPIDKVDEE
jgi:hypothetical protein